MSIVIGRLSLEDPESFAESVGETIARVGATPVPGGRAGLAVSAGLTSFPGASGDTVADRQRVRRQLRSMLNNLPMRLQGLYVAWTEDAEQDGWYVPGSATFDVAGIGSLGSAFWRFTGVELALVGRARTHRRGVSVYIRDRRVSTEARDYLRRVYSTNFSAMGSPTALTWLPSTITDPTTSTGTIPTLTTTARSGFGSSSLRAVVSGANLDVITFEQAAASMNLGDVIAYDRRGTLTGPTAGPAAEWQEVYGPDWESTGWTAATDVPVLDNSLVRVRYDSANVDGFAIDRWTGAAWDEQGKVLIERLGDSTAFCDTLVSSSLVEWSHERAVVRVVMRVAADAQSREEIYITLQRGWNGPRFEVYPSTKTSGVAGAGIHIYRISAPTGTETANKFDASLQTATGVPSFAAAAVGAATFSGENWLLMRRSAVNALILAVLQSGATGRIENNSSAYGAARNGIDVRLALGGYISAHVGINAASTTDAIDSVNGQRDGGRDLGREILYDARSPQVVAAR